MNKIHRRAAVFGNLVLGLALWVVLAAPGCSLDSSPLPGAPDAAVDASVGDGSVGCGALTACGAACVDTTKDLSNCGACGKACDTGLVCSQGQCALTCGGGTTKCGTTCTDTAGDNRNCGACGNVCGGGTACSNGSCVTTCGNGQTLCTPEAGAAYCTNLRNDVSNCGHCNYTCAGGLVCESGACVVSCPSNRVDCNRSCVDPTIDPKHCGATTGCGVADAGSAGAVCPNGTVCSAGSCSVSCPGTQVVCGGACVDPSTDRIHCGATAGCGLTGGSAGTTCGGGQVCNSGTCSGSCSGAQVNCGGICVDPSTDRTHCGATTGCGVGGVGSAGTPCPNGQVCNSGTCSVSCPGTQVNCGGACVNPSTDPVYCGATAGCGVGGVGSAGTTCTNGQVCNGGACSISCPGTEINCSGTCLDPSTDRTHCGATTGCGVGGVGSAGTACPSGQVCNGGGCSVSCPGTEINCSGTCLDPITDRTHCGATTGCGVGGVGSAGTACPSGQVCNGGGCSVSCPGTEVNCSGTCLDPNTDRSHCGATTGCGVGGVGSAGTPCPSGQVCTAGACSVSCPGAEVNCSGTCLDPSTDPTHCGATAGCGVGGVGSAGAPCANGQTCSGGVCTLTCPGTEVSCSGACIQPSTDPVHCGASGACTGATAGTACTSQQHCSSGMCCGAGQVNCGGTCIDPAVNAANCGASGTCTGASAGTACTAGQVCNGGTCLNVVTSTYTITTSSPLVNMFPDTGGCSPGAAQNNCGASFGFSWNDTGVGTVLSASVAFQITGTCATSGTVHAVTLNGTLIGSYTNTTAAGCACNPQPITVTPSTLSPYVEGGTNTFIIGSSTCEALLEQGTTIATVTVQYGRVPVPPGVVHCWPGNGNGNDVVAGDNATVNPDVTYTPGKKGLAFTCSGASGPGNDVVVANRPNVSSTGPWSYDAWVNFVTAPSAPADGYALDRSPAGTPLVSLDLANTNLGTWTFRNDGGALVRPPPFSFVPGQWMHVAAVRAGGVFTEYLNGVAVGSVADPGGALTPDAPRFCGHPADPSYGIRGQIESVRIWNVALSPAQVASIAAGDGSCSQP